MGLNISVTIKSDQRPEEIQAQVARIIQAQTGESPMIRLSVLGVKMARPGAIGEMQQNNIQYNRPWES